MGAQPGATGIGNLTDVPLPLELALGGVQCIDEAVPRSDIHRSVHDRRKSDDRSAGLEGPVEGEVGRRSDIEEMLPRVVSRPTEIMFVLAPVVRPRSGRHGQPPIGGGPENRRDFPAAGGEGEGVHRRESRAGVREEEEDRDRQDRSCTPRGMGRTGPNPAGSPRIHRSPPDDPPQAVRGLNLTAAPWGRPGSETGRTIGSSIFSTEVWSDPRSRPCPSGLGWTGSPIAR